MWLGYNNCRAFKKILLFLVPQNWYSSYLGKACKKARFASDRRMLSMKDGFVKVAACTPKLKLADCAANAQAHLAMMQEAADQGVKLVCFPLKQ